MFQFPLIKFNGIWLTSDLSSTGTRYLVELQGLDKFIIEPSKTFVAIDGTVYEEFTNFNGLPISIQFQNVLPTSVYDDLVDAITASRDTGASIPLFITHVMMAPAQWSFRYSVRCTGIDVPDRTLAAGLVGPKFNFIVTGYYSGITVPKGTYEQVGSNVTLTYSGA